MLVVSGIDGLVLAQTAVLGVGTVLTFLSVRVTVSQYREARAERRLRDIERRLTTITTSITEMTEAAALALQPAREGALARARYNVLQDRYRAALATLRPVGRRLPRCEGLLGAEPVQMLTRAVETALEEVSAEIIRVHLEGPPSQAEIRVLALTGDPPSPLDWSLSE